MENKVIFRRPTTYENQAKAYAMMMTSNIMMDSEEWKERRKVDLTTEIAFQMLIALKAEEIAGLLGFDNSEDMERYVKMGFNVFDLLESKEEA